MTDANLRERAERVGEASGFVHHEEHHGSYGPNQEFEYLCTRCAIERAALEELLAAVAEERTVILKEAQRVIADFGFGDFDEFERWLRVRGQR